MTGLGEGHGSAMIDNSLVEQEDEVTALESIFEETNRFKVLQRPLCPQISENGGCTNLDLQCRLYVAIDVRFQDGVTVNISLPYLSVQGEQVQMSVDKHGPNTCSRSGGSPHPSFNRSQSGRNWTSSMKLKHLSPFELYITLPCTYPSDSAPLFKLSCNWLDGLQLSSLCKELDRIWEENVGNPVIFAWCDWLENEAVRFLGCQSVVEIESSMSVDDDELDSRAVPLCGDVVNVMEKLIEHNSDKEMENFRQSYQTCCICLDERLGAECFRIDACGHHFCYECLTHYCQVHIKDGTVQYLLCPDPDCKTYLPASFLRAVLQEDEYRRWESLLLQKTLNTMSDIQWCPRCNQPVVHDDNVSSQAHCAYCTYTFCSLCRNVYHQGEPCKTLEEVVSAKMENTQQRGEDKLKTLRYLEIIKSEKELKKISKPCPKCRAPITKDGGCNKMVCTQCSAIMCWLCGQSIPGYEHFNSTKCDLFLIDHDPNHIPRPRVERPVHEEAIRIRLALAENPNVQDQLTACPNCKQRSQKQNRNNHMKCWNCKTQFCFVCKNVIKGSVSEHYNGGAAKCQQHS